MTDEPVVWHYGLMAEHWAEFSTEAQEPPFFLKEIAKYGQPALDVGCGTGRVLLPLLRAGIDIDGDGASSDEDYQYLMLDTDGDSTPDACD